ncbi:MAG TPA: hypothetical protein VK524_03440, partial [Polyangiaceae bacterium]|nr:hypothetical protein [Polyangiaceae bacterium]
MNRVMLNRRLFLRGAGIVVALPLLESLPEGKVASAQAATPFKYGIFVRQANGVQQKSGNEP